jgi:DNA-binding Lrp family transcriptional regulator
MKAAGVITAHVALVDPKSVNVGVTVFVNVKTSQHTQAGFDQFHATVESIPEVVEFYRMSGDIDYLLRIVVPDISAYDGVYKRLIAGTQLFVAKPCCSRGPATRAATRRASSEANTEPMANGNAMSQAIVPCHAAAPTPPRAASAITASEVATTLRAHSSVKRVSAGTMTKPPPTPSRPLSSPATTPVSASACAHGGVHTRRPSRASSTQASAARAASAHACSA